MSQFSRNSVDSGRSDSSDSNVDNDEEEADQSNSSENESLDDGSDDEGDEEHDAIDESMNANENVDDDNGDDYDDDDMKEESQILESDDDEDNNDVNRNSDIYNGGINTETVNEEKENDQSNSSECSSRSDGNEQKSVDLLDMSSVASSKNSKELKSKRDNILEKDEKLRARAVFVHCSTHPNKDRIDEEQFNLALTLLGLVEKSEYVRNCFLKEQAEYITYELFLDLLTELRVKNDVVDLVASIQSAFDAIYEGTCEFDDQRDEFGRKYILANDLRNLVTTTGLMLSVEEAGTLIRECRPVKLVSRDGISVDIIYFDQYKTMLLDNNA